MSNACPASVSVTCDSWRLCGSLTEDAARTMVHAFTTSRVIYCNSILHCVSAVHIQPLQKVLSATVRIILHNWKFICITADFWDQLHLLPVQQWIEYNMCVLVYKCLPEAAPTYLPTSVSASFTRRHFHSAVHGNLI